MSDKPKLPPPPPPDEYEDELPSDIQSIAEAIQSTAGARAVQMTPELLREAVVDTLRGVSVEGYPGNNVYDLGLVRGVLADDGGRVQVQLTLPSRDGAEGSPLLARVRDDLNKVFGVTEGVVELVWDPPWSPPA